MVDWIKIAKDELIFRETYKLNNQAIMLGSDIRWKYDHDKEEFVQITIEEYEKINE